MEPCLCGDPMCQRCFPGSKSTYEIMTPIEGKQKSCPHCGKAHSTLPMEMRIAVGFGNANVMKGSECVFDEGNLDYLDCWTVQQAENAALSDPDHDWRIHFYGPLSELHYQRQGDGHWVLYEQGQGFA